MKKHAFGPPRFEIVRWTARGLAGRFHARLAGAGVTICGDPVIVFGEHFMSRPPLDGADSDTMAIVRDLVSTRNACSDCTQGVARYQ